MLKLLQECIYLCFGSRRHIGNWSCIRIEAGFNQQRQGTLFRFQCLVVIAHQNFRRLAAVFRHKLVVIFRQADFVHLPRLAQPLKLDLILNMKGSLPLLKGFIKGLWIKRSSVRLAEQKTVVVILRAKELFVSIDGVQSPSDLLEQRGR